MSNPIMFQFFRWYTPDDGNLWNHCKEEASRLAQLGTMHSWLPPAYKSADGTWEPDYAVTISSTSARLTSKIRYVPGIYDQEHGGCAVMISNGSEGNKHREMGDRFANKIFVDISGNRSEKITVNEKGAADFLVNGESVFISMLEEAINASTSIWGW